VGGWGPGKICFVGREFSFKFQRGQGPTGGVSEPQHEHPHARGWLSREEGGEEKALPFVLRRVNFSGVISRKLGEERMDGKRGFPRNSVTNAS